MLQDSIFDSTNSADIRPTFKQSLCNSMQSKRFCSHNKTYKNHNFFHLTRNGSVGRKCENITFANRKITWAPIYSTGISLPPAEIIRCSTTKHLTWNTQAKLGRQERNNHFRLRKILIAIRSKLALLNKHLINWSVLKPIWVDVGIIQGTSGVIRDLKK